MRQHVRDQRRARAKRRVLRPRSHINMAQMGDMLAHVYLPYMQEMLNNSTLLFTRLAESPSRPKSYPR